VITYCEIRLLEIEMLRQYLTLTPVRYRAGKTQIETDVSAISNLRPPVT